MGKLVQAWEVIKRGDKDARHDFLEREVATRCHGRPGQPTVTGAKKTSRQPVEKSGHDTSHVEISKWFVFVLMTSFPV